MKPILFNKDMVRALLSGQKTVTRRLVKPIPPENARLELLGDRRHAMDLLIEIPGPDDHRIYTPPCLPGDILYVREKFACAGFDGEESVYVYWTEVDDCGRVVWGDLEKSEWAPISDYHWHPSIHMPKEAARIFLRVKDVRVERLQDITEEEARAEGCYSGCSEIAGGPWGVEDDPDKWSAKEMFSSVWNETIKLADLSRFGWTANPWVWVIEFERCKRPEEG